MLTQCLVRPLPLCHPIGVAALLLLSGASAGTAQAAEPRVIAADVCIYGGTSGGVVAAVQAARMGKKTVIVEPGKHLGG